MINKPSRRALRRHHRERIRRKRLKVEWMSKLDPGSIGRYIDTPHPCSCQGCANRRRYEGPTVQERKLQSSIDELESGGGERFETVEDLFKSWADW